MRPQRIQALPCRGSRKRRLDLLKIEAVSLPEVPLKKTVVVQSVEGDRAFRRRIMEMGLVPGTAVRVVATAPLGDPHTIELRASRMSLRRAEAAHVHVRG